MELSVAIKKLLIKEPFYGFFLLGLNKHYGDMTETACVYLDGINCGLCVNKEFWDSQTDELQLAILLHEANHIIFNHLMMHEGFDNMERLNLAQDCVCNSYIKELQVDPFIYPQKYGLELGKGTIYYYDNLPEGIENQFNSNQSEGLSNTQDSSSNSNTSQGKSIDDHSTWKKFEDLSESEKTLVKNQIDYQLKNTTEQTLKSCGNIPGQFKEYIDSLFKRKPAVFNWKSYFRRVLGNIITSELYLTRMRPSRRFPDSRGVKFKKKCSILVGVDTSGSISSIELEDFFSEIHHIWKSGVDVTVAKMDTKIQSIKKYDGRFDGEITGRGGTEFTDLINYYNEHKEFTSLVIFTDGYVSLNLPKFKNCIWVISKNGKHQDYPGISIYIPNAN